MCHLKPHSENHKNAKLNDITKHFASMSKAVDRFHFPGHKKTDKYCQNECNPHTILKKHGISQLNTPACEQAFKWLNEFKNMKTMNEGRFKFFIIYMIDLHNLHIEKSVDIVANPLNKMRNTILDAQTDYCDEKTHTENKSDELCELMEFVMNIDDCSNGSDFESLIERSKDSLHCKLCPGVYKREGNMRNHLESKHGKVFDLKCACGQTYSDCTKLLRHKKTCTKK